MEYPTTRKEAKETGATHYYTGQPCARGHVALRKTKGSCVECMKEDWVMDNEKRKLKPKSEAAKASGRRYYEKNKELVKARATAIPNEIKNKYKKINKQNNLEYYRSLTSMYRRRHREATPKWVTAQDKKAMRQLYVEAQRLTKLTGVKYVVDHHYPLFGKEVCGLHVLTNLVVMTQDENLKKSNKFPVATPDVLHNVPFYDSLHTKLRTSVFPV
jgi:hypothetical protein